METVYEQLRDAVFDDNIETVEHLLQQDGININYHDAGRQTFLHLAAFWGKVNAVRLLIAKGTDLEAVNSAGCTALDLAINWGHSEAAQYIRLQGGTSLAERRIHMLQMKLEDGKVLLDMVEEKCALKETMMVKYRADIVVLHRENLMLETELNRARKEIERQRCVMERLKVGRFRVDLYFGEMKKKYYEAIAKEQRAESLKVEAYEELSMAKDQRDIAVEQYHVAKMAREKAEMMAKASDRATWEAESARADAISARNKLQKKYDAILLENQKLQASALQHKQQYDALAEEAYDFLYEKRKNAARLRRAERALEVFTDEMKQTSKLAAKEFAKDTQTTILKRHHHQVSNITSHEIDTLNHIQRNHELQAFQHEFTNAVRNFADLRGKKWTYLQTQKNARLQQGPSDCIEPDTAMLARRRDSIQRIMTPSMIESISSKRESVRDMKRTSTALHLIRDDTLEEFAFEAGKPTDRSNP